MNRFVIVCLMVVLTAGCESGAEPKATESGVAELGVLKEQHANLLKEAETLRQNNGELEAQLKTEKELLGEAGTPEIQTVYPWAAKHFFPQQWDSVVVKRYPDDPNAVTVTDKDILESISRLLHIQSRYPAGSFPSGTQSDVPTYLYEAVSGGNTVAFRVVGRGTVQLDRINEQSSDNYYRADPYLHQLGNALLPKPAYWPEENVFAKMANSGMMIDHDQGRRYVYFSAFRIHSVVYSFLEAEKKESTRPANVPDEPIRTFEFFYFGENINMNLFKDFVQIKENGAESWDHLKAEDIQRLQSVLSAG